METHRFVIDGNIESMMTSMLVLEFRHSLVIFIRQLDFLKIAFDSLWIDTLWNYTVPSSTTPSDQDLTRLSTELSRIQSIVSDLFSISTNSPIQKKKKKSLPSWPPLELAWIQQYPLTWHLHHILLHFQEESTQ